MSEADWPSCWCALWHRVHPLAPGRPRQPGRAQAAPREPSLRRGASPAAVHRYGYHGTPVVGACHY
jgi:hypothetical protein